MLCKWGAFLHLRRFWGAGDGDHGDIVTVGIQRHFVQTFLVGAARQDQIMILSVVQNGPVDLGQQAPLAHAECPEVLSCGEDLVAFFRRIRRIGKEGIVLIEVPRMQGFDPDAAAEAVIQVEQPLQPQGEFCGDGEIGFVVFAGNGAGADDPALGQGTQLDGTVADVGTQMHPLGFLLQKGADGQ